MKQKTASRSIKILVAKLGLDGHDRGALVCKDTRNVNLFGISWGWRMGVSCRQNW